MKKWIELTALCVLFILLFSPQELGWALAAPAEPPAVSRLPVTMPPFPESTPAPAEPVKQAPTLPAEFSEIPAHYFSPLPADRQGKVSGLFYTAIESLTYETYPQAINKRAMIYLPPGYDKDRQYDVFYFMHGGSENETVFLGTPDEPSEFKNALDHAIGDGLFRPVILVCPTYNNRSEYDSGDFSLSLVLTENYHNELINNLVPAVERRYSTYAAGVSATELIAARDHRGFGGFSNGSVCTWYVFQYALPYFRWYLPISCGTELKEDGIFAAAAGADPDSFFLLDATGSNDFAVGYEEERAERIRALPYFIESDDAAAGNFAFRVKAGYYHKDTAAEEYLFNALQFFFPVE